MASPFQGSVLALAAALAAVAPAAAAPAPVPAGNRLAVLELKNKLNAKDKAEVDASYLTDIVRSAAVKAEPSLQVMTRESLVMLLSARGKTLEECEGECEAETGRNVGADLVVSGELLRVGTNLKLTLKLHETMLGRYLAGSIASGKSVEELEAALPKAVAEVMAPLKGPKVDTSQMNVGDRKQLGQVPEISGKLSTAINLDVDTDVLVLYDAAMKTEPTAKENPAAAAEAWKRLAAQQGRNPYKDEAAARARQWHDYAEERRKLAEQKLLDRDQLRKVLPLGVVADWQKQELLLRYARLYGAEVDELVLLLPEGASRKNAKDAADCELGREPASCLRAAAVHEAAKDLVRAVSFHEKGCERGIGESCERLGALLLEGEGLTADPSRAQLALDKACTGGRAAACKRLALGASSGELGRKDLQKALELYGRACELRDGGSCFTAAEIVRNAQADPAAAMPWYRRACERGEARGCKEVSAAEEKVSAEKAEADRIERARLAAIERLESEKRELRDRLLAQWKEESKEKQAQADSIRRRRYIGYGAAAGGALFGAGAAFFALKGASNNDEVKAGNFANAKGIQDAIDRGKTYNTLTLVFGAVALAGLGAGIPLAIFNLPSSEPKAPEKPTIPPELVLSPIPGGLLLTLRLP